MTDQFTRQLRLQCQQLFECNIAYAVADLVGAPIVEGVQDRLSLFDPFRGQRVGDENEAIAVEFCESLVCHRRM